MFLALLMIVIMAGGALGFDISKLVYERQALRAAVDAAAQVGAAGLSSTALGTTKAAALVGMIKTAAVGNYSRSTYGPGLTVDDVTVAFYCVVANTSGSAAVASPNSAQIPSTCNPNPPSTNYTSGTRCSTVSCAIPCPATTNASSICNSMQVSARKDVQYVFGPMINISRGLASAATVSCRGSCGGEAPPNPMNVVLMADRTPSMSTDQLSAMKTGITNMLGAMNQDQQYVAFGAIGISAPTTSTAGSTMIKAASTSGTAFSDADYATYTGSGTSAKTTWSSQGKLWHFKGTWVPIAYSNSYQATVSGAKVMNTSSQLGSAVSGLASSGGPGSYPAPWHMDSSWSENSPSTSKYNYKSYDMYGQSVSGAGNTHLASALKAAVRYSLNTDPTALGLPDRSHLGRPIRNVVIFETDGSPAEVLNSSDTALSLSNDYDIGATGTKRPDPAGSVQKACDNFNSVAAAAKATNKLTLIMIAVGDAAASSTSCGSTSVARMMAAAASPRTDGTPSDAAASCDTTANRTAENADGDNFYCAADASELKSVFAAAMGNISGGTKFMAIDGVGD